ncbi:hypothetical protein FOZ63_031477 [Perkinsus olseni]|uniref:Uncharacterized protein n=1 Tax=Perkinsus olseni TaxID=32597 RepID=A0A7J6R6B3_PEROL|nr:hypothetical protein FOZ63_031477 [Perkinsus olseni]KAF4753103.1 hypothetical protein FOZ62_008812 [Perkinsus olseni]
MTSPTEEFATEKPAENAVAERVLRGDKDIEGLRALASVDEDLWDEVAAVLSDDTDEMRKISENTTCEVEGFKVIRVVPSRMWAHVGVEECRGQGGEREQSRWSWDGSGGGSGSAGTAIKESADVSVL